MKTSSVILCLAMSAAVTPLYAQRGNNKLADAQQEDPRDGKTVTLYIPAAEKCTTLVKQHGSPEEQLKACREAADIADQFTPGVHVVERRSAYVFYAMALLSNKQPQPAVEYATKAVGLAKSDREDESGSSAAYAVKAQAEAMSGDLPAADADLVTAERQQRAALDSPAGRGKSANYTHGLKSLLMLHAQVLKAMGKQADADARLTEANKL